MKDFKGNELSVGDNVIVIIGRGVRELKEGKVIRITPQKAEIQYSFTSMAYKNGRVITNTIMKESHQLFKL